MDSAGQIVRPDVEASVSGTSAASGDLTFTFNSPEDPFTDEQIASMQTWIGDFYPVVKAIYGPPGRANVVNVSYSPTLSGGTYFIGSNEIVVGDPSAIDVLVHEMIHAFRDDFIVVSQWEETMTRAAELAAFNQLGTYAHWDAQHSYPYDVWVDQEDTQPWLGSTSMSIYDGAPLLLRYNVGGYEWWKVLHAYPAFFSDFNRTLYTRLSDVTEEAALVAIAAASAPTVEGEPFTLWYITHGIFNSAPPAGYHFVISPGTAVGWLVNQSEGSMRPVGGVPVTWQTQAVDGRVLASGSTTTSASGAAVLTKDPTPASYAGRVLLTFTGNVGTETVRGTAWLTGGSALGVFGIAPGLNTGSVTISTWTIRAGRRSRYRSSRASSTSHRSSRRSAASRRRSPAPTGPSRHDASSRRMRLPMQ